MQQQIPENLLQQAINAEASGIPVDWKTVAITINNASANTIGNLQRKNVELQAEIEVLGQPNVDPKDEFMEAVGGG